MKGEYETGPNGVYVSEKTGNVYILECFGKEVYDFEKDKVTAKLYDFWWLNYETGKPNLSRNTLVEKGSLTFVGRINEQE